jgi:hypothetical protein
MSGDIDPRAPTAAAPGSAAKIAVLQARAQARLELFHPLDAAGARQATPHRQRPSTISLRSRRERQLIQVLNREPQSFKKLARVTGVPVRRVHEVLSLLKDAGVAEPTSKGWRLSDVQL